MHFELHDTTMQSTSYGSLVAILGNKGGVESLDVAWNKLQRVAHAKRNFQRVYLVDQRKVMAVLSHDTSGSYRFFALAPEVEAFWSLPFENDHPALVHTFSNDLIRQEMLTIQARNIFMREPFLVTVAFIGTDGLLRLAWERNTPFSLSIAARKTRTSPVFYTDDHSMFRQR